MTTSVTLQVSVKYLVLNVDGMWRLVIMEDGR